MWSTHLTRNAIRSAIDELMKDELIRRTKDGVYIVDYSLYKEYSKYLEKKSYRGYSDYLVPEVELSLDEFEEFFPEDRIHRTARGEKVRSKSEVIIADTLYRLGINYEYEKPLCNPNNHNDIKWPDFTILWKGRKFYWEHLGMMTDAQYRRGWKKKKKWYQKQGFEDQLVISKDQKNGGIDSQKIEQIARKRIMW